MKFSDEETAFLEDLRKKWGLRSIAAVVVQLVQEKQTELQREAAPDHLPEGNI